jgi:hypothetical protein
MTWEANIYAGIRDVIAPSGIRARGVAAVAATGMVRDCNVEAPVFVSSVVVSEGGVDLCRYARDRARTTRAAKPTGWRRYLLVRTGPGPSLRIQCPATYQPNRTTFMRSGQLGSHRSRTGSRSGPLMSMPPAR